MDDLISRQAAIYALGERPVVWNEWTDEYSIGQRNQYDADLLAIETVPTIDPVKHGEWVGTEFDNYADGYPVFYEWACSNCGCVFEDDEPTYNYCPNCGARMERSEE